MLSFFKGLKQMQPQRSVAKISILCRGKSISREELFAYTNGHFLVNEQWQLDRRYIKFDIDALCDVAASAGGDLSRITTVEKLEGGFSKALLMKKENGKEIVAKLACRIAGPASLTTASEVGVLEYVRKYTNVPVPRVLSWSSDKSNPVGAEYIILEKAAGIPLFEQWEKMTEIEKLTLTRNLTKLEAQLSAIHFPVYGGLYHLADANRLEYQALDENIDPSKMFCIGPSCDRFFTTDQATDLPVPSEELDQGPWNTLSSYGIAIAKREKSRILSSRSNSRPLFAKGTIEEQIRLLEITINLMRIMDLHPILSQFSQPTLWHTDLHMGNIFVASDDNARITSLIDFQSISILPLFLQAQWPIFLKPPQNYTKGLVRPKLPDNINELDKDDRTVTLQEWSQSKLAKGYEVATLLENKRAYSAMNIPRVFRDIFVRCSEISEVGAIPLRECLIEIQRSWLSLGFIGDCPISFNNEEINAHKREFAEYQAWDEAQQLALECLDTDAEGWIAPQLDISEKRRQNRELLAMYIERKAMEKPAGEVRALWPFPDDL
ncbi:phosphotransferase enzyme family protein [Aspergillus pseudotamarii]|uniref:Altered inheritance of mitochondria protein 9, mitochondrial n=1 Tax=Aspergillus pseudotamarii TaxID=132259 RepID=A0A5N6T1R2_ASPPS|nr:phosphotransferase enzyme family protein [Aspergillus pseudotamarii]KAE8140230.1 phosphotransferase enzyme family protein [Aspergillus pseudotamarii]